MTETIATKSRPANEGYVASLRKLQLLGEAGIACLTFTWAQVLSRVGNEVMDMRWGDGPQKNYGVTIPRSSSLSGPSILR